MASKSLAMDCGFATTNIPPTHRTSFPNQTSLQVNTYMSRTSCLRVTRGLKTSLRSLGYIHLKHALSFQARSPRAHRLHGQTARSMALGIICLTSASRFHAGQGRFTRKNFPSAAVFQKVMSAVIFSGLFFRDPPSYR